MDESKLDLTLGVRDDGDVLSLFQAIANRVKLAGMQKNDEEYSSYVAGLSFKLKVSLRTAKALTRLSLLIDVEDTKQYLRQNCSFYRVYSTPDFLRAVRSDSTADDYIGLDFLQCFIGYSDLPSMQCSWEYVAKKFRPGAQSTCALAFFKFVAFSSTVCGWLGAYEEPEVDDVVEVLEKFVSAEWGTSSMATQKGPAFSRKSMCAGWRIVSETLKLKTEELRVQQVRTLTADVSSDHVDTLLRSWSITVIQETVIWMLLRMEGRESLSGDYLRSKLDVILRNTCKKLVDLVSHEGTVQKEGTKAETGVCIDNLISGLQCGVSLAQLDCEVDGEMRRLDTTLPYENHTAVHARLGPVVEASSEVELQAGQIESAVLDQQSQSSQQQQSPPKRRSKRSMTLVMSSRRLRRRLEEIESDGEGEGEGDPVDSDEQLIKYIKDRIPDSSFVKFGGPAPQDDVVIDKASKSRFAAAVRKAEIRQREKELRREQEQKTEKPTLTAHDKSNTGSACAERNASSELDDKSEHSVRPLPRWLRKANQIQHGANELPVAPLLQKEQFEEHQAYPLKHNRTRRHIDPFQLQTQHGTNLQEMRNALLGYPEGNDDFTQDNPESDNEEMAMYSELYEQVRKNRSKQLDRILQVDCEIFYASLTFWNVDPNLNWDTFSVPHIEKPRLSLRYGDDEWLRSFLENNEHLMRLDATFCEGNFEYSNHLKCLLHLELFYTIQSALLSTFPGIKRSPQAYMQELKTLDSSMFIFKIEKLELSKLLVNMKCVHTNRALTKKVVDDITGLNVSIAYFKRGHDAPDRGQRSHYFLVGIRSLCYDDEKEEVVTSEGDLDQVALRAFANRSSADVWRPRKGDLLVLLPLTSLTSLYRMFRSSHDICLTLPRLRNVLCGKHIPQAHGSGEPSSKRRITIEADASPEPLRVGVDEGCLQYLDALTHTDCDEYQRKAVLASLQEMGDLRRGSSSASLIIGPPGTGKTRCISLLVSALLHHSTAGHKYEGCRPVNALGKNDGKVRFTETIEGHAGLRILICSNSNHAVDNIARRLKKGLPDGQGGLYMVDMLRVGRFRYKYGDLSDISVSVKGLEFEQHLYDEARKTNPDLQAIKVTKSSARTRRKMAQESVVVLCTASSSFSSVIRNLKLTFDVVIFDEASHSCEQESLIPIAAAAKSDQQGYNRMHMVVVGDHKQLPPVLMCEHPVKSYLRRDKSCKFQLPFRRHIISLFDRLLEHRRCPVAWLCKQYRTHPAIGRIQTPPVYGNMLRHPEDAAPYMKPFTDPENKVFSPFTFIDTRNYTTRFELNQRGGSYVNNFEVDQVEKVLYRLQNFATQWNSKHPECEPLSFDGRIFITSPYKSQVMNLREKLRRAEDTIAAGVKGARIETVDSLQGCENSVVIVSMTRSNRNGGIGFLRDFRRINVAMSRSQHLLVIIGDSSTLLQQSKVMNYYWTACLKGQEGSKLDFLQPPRHLQDTKEAGEVKQLTSGIMRWRNGYNLRSENGTNI